MTFFVVVYIIYIMAFIRKIKKGNNIYLAEVANYRENGKVKQKVIRYIGKEENGEVVRRVRNDKVEVQEVKEYLDYKVLHTIAKRLGLTEVFGRYSKYILLMIYTQIVSKKSLYRLPEYIERTALKELLGIDKIIDKNLYLAIDYLDEMDFNKVERMIYEKLSEGRSDKRCFVLDITDTYFSGSQAEWRARRGKDNQYSKLIQIALAVSYNEGFPILHKVYEGNINNIKVFEDLMSEEGLRGLEVILLDRGMISYEAIKDITNLGHRIICGLRINNKIKNKYISVIEREEIFQPEYLIELKNTTVYAKGFDFNGGQLIAIYNPEIEITKRMKAMTDKNTYNRDEAKFMGYSLIYHTTDFSIQEVIKRYYGKDVVEKAFRELKSSINLNPIRKYRIERVRSHIKICYLAYAMLSYIENKVKVKGISAVDAIEKLQSAYKVELVA